MRTRMKIMGLAALAREAGTPAGTKVVQQAAVRAADPCPDHVVKAVQRTAAPCPQHVVKAAIQPVQQQQVRDRDCRDHKAPQPAGTATRAAAHTHHGQAIHRLRIAPLRTREPPGDAIAGGRSPRCVAHCHHPDPSPAAMQ